MTTLKVLVSALTTAVFFMVATALAVVSLLAAHLVAVSVAALLIALIVGYRRRRGVPTTALPPSPVMAPRPPAAMVYRPHHSAAGRHGRALPPRPVR